MKDPVRYSRKLFKDICDQLAAGKSLRAVCRAEGYPSPSNVIAWVLADKDGGTLLTYNVEAQIGGKLAQLGQRLINGSAKKLADEFFANFAKAVQG